MAEGGRQEGARTGPARPVVLLAQLGVLQLVVRLRELLELDHFLRVAVVAHELVRVGLDRLPAEGLRDLLGGRGLLDADDLVQALAMARHARLALEADAAAVLAPDSSVVELEGPQR